MPRAIWDGNINFGLINIPIHLYSLTTKADIDLHWIDKRDGARVRYLRVNADTGEEVPWKNLAKGYEYEDDEYVILETEDLKKLHLKSSQSIDLEEFVDIQEIPYYYFDKPYLLVPSKKAMKSYTILKEALAKNQKAALGKVTIRTREHFAAIIAEEDGLVLNLLRFPTELKQLTEFDLPEQSAKELKITKKEINLAEQLIETQTGGWSPEKYRDDFRKALDDYVKKQIKEGRKKAPAGEKAKAKKKEEKPSNVLDIASLLERSLKENKKKSG